MVVSLNQAFRWDLKTNSLSCGTQLATEFREMKGASVSNLMYVKEDLIIPNQHSFYELIINKARGKSGPLFHFDVHEDIRLQNDARIEKDESHAGKVVERHWYSRSDRHLCPAISRTVDIFNGGWVRWIALHNHHCLAGI